MPSTRRSTRGSRRKSHGKGPEVVDLSTDEPETLNAWEVKAPEAEPEEVKAPDPEPKSKAKPKPRIVQVPPFTDPAELGKLEVAGCVRDLGAVGVTTHESCLEKYNPLDYDALVRHLGVTSGRRVQRTGDRKDGEPWDLTDGLPIEVDHSRWVTCIRDQGTTNQCGGFSSAAAYEILFNRSAADQGIDRGAEPFQVSPGYTYFHANFASKIDNGVFMPELLETLVERGVVNEEAWPFKPENFSKSPPVALDYFAKEHQIIDILYCNGSVDATRAALANGFPVVIGFPVFENIVEATQSGLVPYDTSGKSKVVGGHAVTIVGYNDVKQLFKFVNSWGVHWGDGGYGYMHYTFYDALVHEGWAICSEEAPELTMDVAGDVDGDGDADFHEYEMFINGKWRSAKNDKRKGTRRRKRKVKRTVTATRDNRESRLARCLTGPGEAPKPKPTKTRQGVCVSRRNARSNKARMDAKESVRVVEKPAEPTPAEIRVGINEKPFAVMRDGVRYIDLAARERAAHTVPTQTAEFKQQQRQSQADQNGRVTSRADRRPRGGYLRGSFQEPLEFKEPPKKAIKAVSEPVSRQRRSRGEMQARNVNPKGPAVVKANVVTARMS